MAEATATLSEEAHGGIADRMLAPAAAAAPLAWDLAVEAEGSVAVGVVGGAGDRVGL